MKAFIFCLFISCVTYAQQDPNAGIIPAPASITRSSGEFAYGPTTVIKTDQPNNKAVRFLMKYLKKKPVTASSSTSIIELTTKGADQLPAEGYTLTVTPKKITIVGKEAGLFYGMQSLLQLFPVHPSPSFKIPCLTIKDQPRFAYRGMMLDVSRHFFTVDEVKQFIDLLATYKLNRFHWHLVDNNGWRIEIKKYPKLKQVGAWRTNEYILGIRDWPEHVPYGGFYTQEQIREVVQYAADRYITTVPEIEMPAHSVAALRAYPEYKCELPADSKNKDAYNIIFCPTEATFKFLEDVLTEVIALFPGEYVHIGGDEANKQPWKESAFCQNLIKQLDLKDEHGLQSYFISRMEKFLNAKGKSIIGWDEILEGGLAPNATVMSWRGEAGGIAAAKQKHKVVMTPERNGLYFDYAQSKSDQEPITFGNYVARSLPLQATYSYDPVPSSLTKEEQQYIIGVQANVWTEVIANQSKLQYMTLPRIFAISEIAWSPVEKKDFNNLSTIRMLPHLQRFDEAGLNYRVPTAIGVTDTTLIGDQFTFTLQPSVPGAKIYYTLTGKTPTDLDLVYKEPIHFSIPANEKRELQTMVITPAGRRSIATRTILYNKAPLQPVHCNTNRPGLHYYLFKQPFTCVEQVPLGKATDSGQVNDLSLGAVKKDGNPVGIIYEGFIRIDTAGVYNFSLAAQGGAQLFIGGEQVVEQLTPITRLDKKGTLPLAVGDHPFKLVYYDNRSHALLKVKMSRPGEPETDIPAGKLFY